MASEQKDIEMIQEQNNNTDNGVAEYTNSSEQATSDNNKIKLLPQATSEDGTCASFQITDEDHTLGNSLRYMIMKNPEVEFVGYSIPHPTENFLHLRIQTYGQTTAIEAFHKGLQDLMDLCDVVEDKFTENIKTFKN